MTRISSAVLIIAAVFLMPQGPAAAGPGYVNDYANLLQTGDEAQIVSIARELEQKTTAQLAVVTVESTQPKPIEMAAVELFEKWGIGQKGKDNGVLLLVALKDRKVRIENGYGLEGVLTDALSQQIISRLIVPEFKAGRFSQGIRQGAVAIVSLIAQDAGVEISGAQPQMVKNLKQRPNILAGLFRLLFMIFFMMMLASGRGGLFTALMLGSMMGGGRHRGSWYGSGSGFGGFSGGFGGFGGGLSGGGGASGSW